MDLSWLVGPFGYLGIFIISAVMTANILLPYPAVVTSVAAGAALNPLLVGIFSGLGAAAGELVGYGLGYKGRTLLSKRMKKAVLEKRWGRTEKLFHKYGGLLVFVIAATPLPDDILGMICGAIRYDVLKFYLFSAAGKVIIYTVFAITGKLLFGSWAF